NCGASAGGACPGAEPSIADAMPNAIGRLVIGQLTGLSQLIGLRGRRVAGRPIAIDGVDACSSLDQASNGCSGPSMACGVIAIGDANGVTQARLSHEGSNGLCSGGRYHEVPVGGADLPDQPCTRVTDGSGSVLAGEKTE